MAAPLPIAAPLPMAAHSPTSNRRLAGLRSCWHRRLLTVAAQEACHRGSSLINHPGSFINVYVRAASAAAPPRRRSIWAGSAPGANSRLRRREIGSVEGRSASWMRVWLRGRDYASVDAIPVPIRQGRIRQTARNILVTRTAPRNFSGGGVHFRQPTFVV